MWPNESFKYMNFFWNKLKIQRDVHKLLNDIISWQKTLVTFTLNWKESGA